MASYRITFKEAGTATSVNEFLGESRTLPQNRLLAVQGRTEIRSSEGDVFRLQKGAEFELKEMEEGIEPEVTGEVFGIIMASWPKYTTSCFSCGTHSSPPLQLLIRPSRERENTDEYLLAMGDMVIHEFDENGRYYVICNVRQGEKAYVRYDRDIAVGTARYSAEVVQMDDPDWKYILEKYLDHRRWMQLPQEFR